ncbi:hypothetical protein CYMTET_56088 [Cymbomonas tetramitiformis]|uniref:Uncharacterized protein n=1 Tax=Cymbomonas tetramitiformis TaxID=36881 RepID=A0AAE0BBN5_9CHLO|nr:hypothetical protein CYMTET_56088 [Cymbomonas tetramitiformis]
MDGLYIETNDVQIGKNASTIQLELRLRSSNRRDAETPPSRVPLSIDAAHPIVAPLQRYIADRERVIKVDNDQNGVDSQFSSAVLCFQTGADVLARRLSEIRFTPWMRCVPELDACHVKRRAAGFATRWHTRSLRAYSGRRATYCVMAYNALTSAAEFISGDLLSEKISRSPEFKRVVRSHCVDALHMAVNIARDAISPTLGAGEEALSPMEIVACTACTFSFAKCAIGSLSRMREATATSSAWRVAFRELTADSPFFSDDDDDAQRNATLLRECRSQLFNAVSCAHRYAHATHLGGTTADHENCLARCDALLEEADEASLPNASNRRQLVQDFQDTSAMWWHRLPRS